MRAWWLRILYFGIPAVALLAGVLAFNSNSFLLRPMGTADDVEARLEEVSTLALAGQWEGATAATEGLNRAWDQVKQRVLFSLAMQEVETFDIELAELWGAVDGRDKTAVRITTRRLRALWEDFKS